jgi:flagellar hook protein FlgE
MVSSLYSGVSGIQQFQSQLDVIGNNIANSDTYGYKSGRADFEDAFSNSMQSGGGSSQIQIGSGVVTGAIRSNFDQGAIARTGVASDLAIKGDGYFMVKDATSGETFATRAGDFHVDKDGYLVSNEGFRVQGFSDSGLSTRDSIRIDDTGKPDGDTSSITNFRVETDGKVTVVLGSGKTFTRGQVLLQRFSDPSALTKEGNNLFSGIDTAGPLAAPDVPDTNGLGQILGGQVETSNVDLAGEFANMIVTQRAFQASARIITTTDEMLQEVVNLKH